MITLCVGIYNRTSELINYLIASMNECKDRDQLDLSIFDCKSNDVEDLEGEIKKTWKGKMLFKSEDKKFTRAYTFNNAVLQAESDKIFICDADMTIPIDFVEQYNNLVNKETVWFPICFSLFKNKKREVAEGNGWWRGEGHGMVGIIKDNFKSLGGYDMKYENWGGEDDDLFVRAHTKFKVIRNICLGLFHNWHPPSDQFGGRNIDDNQNYISQKSFTSSKDLTSRSRELLLAYVKKLILSGENNEARYFLYRKYPYEHDKHWWKMWLGSFMPKLILKRFVTR